MASDAGGREVPRRLRGVQGHGGVAREGRIGGGEDGRGHVSKAEDTEGKVRELHFTGPPTPTTILPPPAAGQVWEFEPGVTQVRLLEPFNGPYPDAWLVEYAEHPGHPVGITCNGFFAVARLVSLNPAIAALVEPIEQELALLRTLDWAYLHMGEAEVYAARRALDAWRATRGTP